MRRLALTLALTLMGACHGRQVPGSNRDLLAGCGAPAALGVALAAELARGRPPEASRQGSCVANAANKGSVAAAMLLSQIYGAQAGTQSASAALRLDVFGRYVNWLRIAAERGHAPAQLLLAQATDSTAYGALPDMALAWYQVAAEAGNDAAMAAIGTAYDQGRIPDERLHDLRNWLSVRANPSPAARELRRRLNRPPAIAPPD